MTVLEEIQKSALKEIGNIGAGHAATALGQLVGKKINITLPSVQAVSPKGFLGTFDSQHPLVGTRYKVTGEAQGEILFLLTEKNAFRLLDLVMSQLLGTTTLWGAMEESALKETGSILSAAYLSALNQMMRLHLIPSVPRILFNQAGGRQLQTESGDRADTPNGTVGIVTEFLEASMDIRGHFLFTPDAQGLSLILAQLGVPSLGKATPIGIPAKAGIKIGNGSSPWRG